MRFFPVGEDCAPHVLAGRQHTRAFRSTAEGKGRYHAQQTCGYGMVWYGMVWYGMVWYGMVWYGNLVPFWTP